MFKDLLVEIDDQLISAKRTDYAIKLTQRFDGHLTGLFLISVFMPPPAVGVYLIGDMEAQMLDGEKKRAETAIDMFKQAAAAEDIEFETRTDTGPYHEHAALLSLHGRYADLTVIGQPEPDALGKLDPGDVILAAGAPVVIVPHIGTPKTCAERVMVAWNASRESARAVRDAMPLLEKAKAVDVVCVEPKQSTTGHGDLPGADIALHLSRHGIDVDVQVLEGQSIDVGNALLSHAADRGSDFLVMGGYGYSRMREAVLGGATRTVLQSMTMPVLMAH